MPIDQAKLKATGQRTTSAIARCDQEIAKVREDQKRHAKTLGESVRLLDEIAANDLAKFKLTEFSKSAVKLAEAYAANSSNLRDEADLSGDLMLINYNLAMCYAVVAIGKVFDVIATLTGEGKIITSAKNSITDICLGVQKQVQEPQKFGTQDATLVYGQTANLTLMMVGGEGINFAKEFDDLQKIVNALLGLVKDVPAMWKGSDLKVVLPQFRQAVPQALNLIAKFSSAANRLVSLYTTLAKPQGQNLPISLTTINAAGNVTPGKVVGQPTTAVVKAENLKQFGDLLAAIKYGIEAVENLWQSASSFIDMWESWEAKDKASALAERQLGVSQGGIKGLDIDVIAGLSGGGPAKVIRTLDTQADAREAAIAAFNRAHKLKEEAERMRRQQMVLAAQIGPETEAIRANVISLRTTDKELQDLRKEFQALEPGRDVYSLEVAVWLSDIDGKRTRIAEALGEQYKQ